jgi:methylmalonyl-CoA mutase cobalamin-binding subunit
LTELEGIVSPGFPRGADLIAEGRRVAKTVTIGRTAFLEHMGLSSEREYREIGREKGQIFAACNIGMNTWADTADALRLIEAECFKRGVRPPDHFQFIPQRRMGLPREMRAEAPAETGPMLWTPEDWHDWSTAVVSMQPEAGDNMIGGPASVTNAIDALNAGSTYVGCLSQFTWRWPYFDDEVVQLSEVVRACSLVGALSSRGAVLDTYLEDGFAGVFVDYASLVGWSLVERWLARLMGAKLSVCWGGLTSDPRTKSVVTMALELLNPERIPAAFMQGDTISYTADLDRNAALCTQDVMYMMAVQAHYRTGSAALAVPLTELQRVPSWDEIAQVQLLAREVERRIPSIVRTIDWAALEREAALLASAGRRFYGRVRAGLAEAGVDLKDPFRVMLALRRLGAARIEELWGIGAPDERVPRGHRPYLPTELMARTIAERDGLRDTAVKAGSRLAGLTIVAASTDVHEMALTVLTGALAAEGATVVEGGLNRDPEDIRDSALKARADAVVVTTHNGVAWSFGSAMRDQWERSHMTAPIYMGGVLNENLGGSPTPIDVRGRLNEAGILTPATIADLVEEIVRSRADGRRGGMS